MTVILETGWFCQAELGGLEHPPPRPVHRGGILDSSTAHLYARMDEMALRIAVQHDKPMRLHASFGAHVGHGRRLTARGGRIRAHLLLARGSQKEVPDP